jgi:HK97 family phage major capsid protein
MSTMTLHAPPTPGLPISTPPVSAPSPSPGLGPQSLADFVRSLFVAWDPDCRAIRHNVLERMCPGIKMGRDDGPSVGIGISRTMTGETGPSAGYLVRPEWADFFFDKIRELDGMFARLGVFAKVGAREFRLPAFNEVSRQDTKRWGGVFGYWEGQQETRSATSRASQPAASQITFSCSRLFVYSQPISRDLAADSPSLFKQFFDYACYNEIRWMIEAALLVGNGDGMPQGVLNSDATIVVAKDGGQTNATITDSNLKNMWARLHGPSRHTAVWLACEDAVNQIDAAASAAGWPSAFYNPSGEQHTGPPLIKGRPLLISECLPALGTPGDIVLVDPTQYGFVYHQMSNNDSGLEVDLRLPGDIIERMESSDFLFQNDELMCRFKIRADGRCLWGGPLTIANGSKTVGPAVIIEQR